MIIYDLYWLISNFRFFAACGCDYGGVKYSYWLMGKVTYGKY
jgi:hypothetical protein